MATSTKKESSLGKEKRGTSPSNSSKTHGTRRPSPGSAEKQVPNYLKPTISSRNDIAIKNFKKAGPEDNTSQKPELMRRRSFDRPPSAGRVHKALTSPGREKPKTLRSASFGSKTMTTPKSSLERVAKKPINAGKPETLSSFKSMKKATSTTITTKKGSASSASKKPPSSHDKKEAQNIETKNEDEETLDKQLVDEVVTLDDEGEIDDSEIPKLAEEISEHSDVIDITEEVKSDEQGKDKFEEEEKSDHVPAVISTVSREHNVPAQTEEKMEDKFEEEKHDHIQNDEDKENHSKEEINVSDHDHQEKVPHEEEAKTETNQDHEGEGEDSATDNVAATKEIGEEKQLQGTEEDDEGAQEVIESSNLEETVEEKVEEPEAEATNVIEQNVVGKSQVQGAENGKKESPTAYNDVIEETASKLREERKNKVRALVGAFETVIDNAK
ncbi:hypothetical protein PTKIN_Ptkin03bG0169900 [Pterospermum kingtungense]